MIRRPPRSTRTYTLFPYTTCFRSVIIGPVGFEARDLDMDAVAQFGMREFGALGHDVAKAPVARDLPVDRHRRQRHAAVRRHRLGRSEEHTSELQSLMRISYAVFCLKKKNKYIE